MNTAKVDKTDKRYVAEICDEQIPCSREHGENMASCVPGCPKQLAPPDGRGRLPPKSEARDVAR
jgi:hypothetical protein